MSPSKLHRCIFLHILFLTIFFIPLQSQENNGPYSFAEEQKISVYVNGFTDTASLVEEISFAHFVTDRNLAQVLIVIDAQNVSTQGREYIISFSGQADLKGIRDELRYLPEPGETEETINATLVKTIKIGLIKYAARTAIGENISIDYEHTEEQVAAVKDKWNYWLFSINFNFDINGEKSMKGGSVGGGFSARRITDSWKIRASAHTYYNKNTFDMEEIDLAYTDITRNSNFHGLLVKSINDHWSVGAFAEASQATYYNNQFSSELAPALEYNIFPYIESEKRSFTFLYRFGYIYKKYWEETIYGKIREGLLQTSLMADVEIYKDWGSIESSLTGSVYLKDFTKNRLTWSFEIDVRIFKQLKFDIEWRVSMIHDQVFLERGGVDYEEVLLRRKRLETLYDYSIELGFSYSFGNLNNNVLNPVFGN